MRHFMSAFVLAAALTSSPVFAQGAPSAGVVMSIASSREVADLIAQAKAEIKEGQNVLTKRVTSLAPFSSNLEYRVGPGPTMQHEKDAELFVVLDGTATLTMGGKLVNEKRLNPENLSGSGAEGGTTKAFGKGDILIIPPNTPHSFTITNGPLVMVSVHFVLK